MALIEEKPNAKQLYSTYPEGSTFCVKEAKKLSTMKLLTEKKDVPLTCDAILNHLNIRSYNNDHNITINWMLLLNTPSHRYIICLTKTCLSTDDIYNCFKVSGYSNIIN